MAHAPVAHTEDWKTTSDAEIRRDRFGRTIFGLLSATTALGVPMLILSKISFDWFSTPVPGLLAGFLAGGWLISRLYKYYIVKVGSQGGFMTVNELASLFAEEKVLVSYGTGTHVSYPWESRQKRNNVTLTEFTENFTLEVQGKTGAMVLEGSVRLRTDLRLLDEFLGGVAALVDDVIDVIASQLTATLADKSVEESRLMIPELNEMLLNEFVEGTSNFEKRFGVKMGDITIARIVLPKEMQETRNAIDEALIIAQGTAIMLGYITPDNVADVPAMKKALEEKQVSRADHDKARDRFMAASNNIKMDLKANEITIKVDADPAVADAIKNAGPALLTALTTFNSMRGPAPQKGK